MDKVLGRLLDSLYSTSKHELGWCRRQRCWCCCRITDLGGSLFSCGRGFLISRARQSRQKAYKATPRPSWTRRRAGQGRARRDASRAGAGGGSGLLRQGRCAGLEVLLPERELTYQLAAGVSGFESTRFAGAAFAQQLRPGPKLAPSGAGLAKPRSEPPQVEQRIRQVEGEVQEMRQEAAALAPYARLAGMQTQRTKLKRLADQPAFLRLPTIASSLSK